VTTFPLEEATQNLARSLLKTVQKEENSNLILNWTLERPELRRQLFQLVDCLPTLENNPAIAQHIKEYLTQENPNELPKAIREIINFKDTDSFQAKTTAVTFQMRVFILKAMSFDTISSIAIPDDL
jgi:RHH-type proline utilization regulon transcriptional repressor/proline dehydrogenase/delta 1-pyrroline-5-carboxylate dehydrogenase